MRIRLAVAALAGVGLLAGCADVVDGTGALGGTGAPSGSSSSPDFPGQSSASSGSVTGSPSLPSASGSGPSSTAVPPTPCPHVSYAAAKLSFDCITTGLTARSNPVWPLAEAKTVEPSTGWVLEEGAGHWGAAAGRTLSEIAKSVRTQMIDGEGYGTNPTVTTLADDDTTVDGAEAHLLHSKMTLDPAWVAKQSPKTAVKQEQLWILAIKVGTDDVSLWYSSIPDLASELWTKVPSIIKSIKVG
jgi:hypothetical protein